MIRRLSLENVTLTRGGRQLFGHLTLCLHAGEAVALTGVNGAGKTSLLRAVAGLLRLEAGNIAFHGAVGALDVDEARAKGLHLLGHQDGLKTNRTAREELSFWSRWTGAAEDGI